jgi:tRNA(fMet)-specific endonuclease VapC
MGIVIDTGVLIRWEREDRSLDLSEWASLGKGFISVMTASELLVGMYRADTEARQTRRTTFANNAFFILPVIPISFEVAKIHARLKADLAIQGLPIGAHDLWIAATAVTHRHSVLTTNPREFSRVEGLSVVAFS